MSNCFNSVVTHYLRKHNWITVNYSDSVCHPLLEADEKLPKIQHSHFCCFTVALIHHLGAPSTAVYKFLRCNPADGQANCVTQQSAEMPWSPELPSKLPASDKETGRKPEREEL
uniref:Uncharacterized protein n=1 Tax=Poecilia latipinna TaxID=48699 RepID=A0A3B3UAA1_9TELE